MTEIKMVRMCRKIGWQLLKFFSCLSCFFFLHLKSQFEFYLAHWSSHSLACKFCDFNQHRAFVTVIVSIVRLLIVVREAQLTSFSILPCELTVKAGHIFHTNHRPICVNKTVTISDVFTNYINSGLNLLQMSQFPWLTFISVQGYASVRGNERVGQLADSAITEEGLIVKCDDIISVIKEASQTKEFTDNIDSVSSSRMN